MPAAAEPPSRRRAGLRAALLFGLPTLILLVAAMLPVILGRETLVLRDVIEVHLALKASQAEALREGVLPVLDPHRSGGQPLLGNPNAVPFYPDNVLYVVAPVLWALNAHFWIHWALALAAAYWMARAWGLERSAAWAAAVCYALSGFFLSQLNFYNLVAGAALVPALVAAALRATGGSPPRPRWAAPAAGLLWALLVLSGDPSTAAVGALLAASAVAVRHPRELLRLPTGGALVAATILGTLVALPQIVEFLRILPASFRGHWGYSDWRFSVGAWQPAQALEWLVPLAFGRPDLQGPGEFWARPLFGGILPLFFSLYPGVLALGLVLASGRPGGRRGWWAWGSIALGLFLAAGGTNPVGRWLFDLPGTQGLRYPVKFWLLVAVGATLLCGIGWQRTFGERGPALPGARPGRLGRALAAIGGLLGIVWGFVVLAPGRFEGLVLEHARAGFSPDLAAVERGRWIATLVTVSAVLLALALALWLARRRPVASAALLLLVHAGGQLHLLGPLLLTDRADLYRTPPALLAGMPRGARVAHAEYVDLFGPSPVRPMPDNRGRWILRQDFHSLVPAAGILHGGVRYELNRSPEGLDSFLSRMAYEAVWGGPTDADRVRGLSRWGVEYVISDQVLRDVPEELARGVGSWPGPLVPVHLYRLPEAAEDVLFAETELRAPHINATWDLLRSPGFDPERFAILPGEPEDPVPVLPDETLPQATVRVRTRSAESHEVEVVSPVAGVLVFQRALLPVWRGTVDGEPVELEPANLYRIGVRVPAGRHRVRLWVDRKPLHRALGGSAAGALGLAALALALRRRSEAPDRRPADTIPGS